MRKAATMLVVGALLVALSAGIAVAAVSGPDIQCDGLGDENPKPKKCKGTKQGDFIAGNDYGETIKALAGEDRVDAAGGNDKVSGGKDNDDIDGGTGNDTLRGDAGDDNVTDKAGPNTGDPPDKDVVYLGKGGEGSAGVDRADVHDGDGEDIVDCGDPFAYSVDHDAGDKLRNC